MALTLLSTPEKTVNLVLSNVAGARSQLPYTFQREDYLVANVFESNAISGRIRAIFPVGADVSSDFSNGDRIYLYSPTGNKDYNGIYTVDFADYNGTETRIYFLEDGVFTVNGLAGYVNNLSTRKNYKVVTKIQKVDYTNWIDIEFKYSPDPTGRLFLDIGALLTELHEDTVGASLLYRLGYKQIWTGYEESYLATGVIQSVYSEKQLLDEGGSNFWEYLLNFGFSGESLIEYWFTTSGGGLPEWFWYTGYTLDGYPEAWRVNNVPAGSQSVKLQMGKDLQCNNLTYFELEVTYSNKYTSAGIGLPVPICLVDGNLGCLGLRDYPDTNGAIGTHTVSYANISQALVELGLDTRPTVDSLEYLIILEVKIKPYLGHLLTVFKNPLKWKGFYRSVNMLVDENYSTRLGDTRNRIDTEALDINKVRLFNIGTIYNQSVNTQGAGIRNAGLFDTDEAYIRVKCTLDGGLTLNEYLTFKMIQEPCENGVYVRWVNSKGGLEEHLFSRNQAVERVVEQGLLAESVINEDIENVNRTKKRLPNTWHESLILEADNLTRDQLVALAEIKQSDYVVVLLDKQATKLIYCIVSNGYETIYDTKDDSFSYTLQLEFPDNYDVLQALEY